MLENAEFILHGKLVSPLHYKIFLALSKSEEFNCFHIEIRNESYWYNMRSRMGVKQSAVIIESNITKSRYEGYIYRLKPRDEDLEIVPQKHYVGTYSSRWAAFKACEAAGKERDADPTETIRATIPPSIDPNRILCTHLKMIIVSDSFDRLLHTDRLILVYSILLKSLGEQPHSNNKPVANSNTSYKQNVPSRARFCSTFGAHVSSLPIFRYIRPESICNLIIEAKTPSQWRGRQFPAPDSERFGPTHTGLKASRISATAMPVSNRKRVKELAMVKPKSSPVGSQSLGELRPGPSQSQGPLQVGSRKKSRSKIVNKIQSSTQAIGKIGKDNSISTFVANKRGGVYGHFFDDISNEFRDMILSEHRRNKKMIMTDGNSKKRATCDTPIIGSRSGSFAKTSGERTISEHSLISASRDNFSLYDSGTKTESDMVEEVYLRARVVELAAVRMQRMWRLNCFQKAIRVRWRREYAALTIQRVLRGHYGRCYASLLTTLQPLAATRIQRVYRRHRRRVLFTRFVVLVIRAGSRVLPLVKRFLRRCASRRLARYEASALIIQRLVRRQLAVIRRYRLYGERIIIPLFTVFCLKIQRCYRGWLARQRVKQLWEEYLHERIVVPAAMLLQRFFRGTRGRISALTARKQRNMAIKLQRWARQQLHHRMERRRLRAWQMRSAACIIQRVYRGRLDREMSQRLMQKKWYETIYIPSVVTVQSLLRMMYHRYRLNDLKRQHRMAKIIQNAYRLYRRLLATRARFEALAQARRLKRYILIQRVVRGWLARLHMKNIRYEAAGRRILAAKTILRAWVTYRDSKRLQKLVEENRLARLTKRIFTLQDSRKSVLADIHEIEKDIEAAKNHIESNKSRIKELFDFTVEANMRLPTLMEEMGAIDPSDIDGGWGEAYGLEFESLTYQNLMARRELRQRKALHRKNQRELLWLQLELEQSHLEHFEVASKEVETCERFRSAEVGRVERRVTDIRAREVRVERTRWGISSVRRKVIARKRERLLQQESAVDPQLVALRDFSAGRLAAAQSVSYERRARQEDREAFARQELETASNRKIAEKERTYEVYAKPFQDTFDTVVADTQALLSAVTLDLRAGIQNERLLQDERREKMSKKGVTAALKQEYSYKRAFDYLGKSNTS